MHITEFDAIRKQIRTLPAADHTSVQQAKRHQKQLTKPEGALGALEDVAVWLAGWQKREKPTLEHAHMLVFAGNHGVTKQGVSAFPAEVTLQMVHNFARGGAAINQLCHLHDIALKVIDLQLDTPVHDFTQKPAMSEAECCAAIQAGYDCVNADMDVLMVGEMGIGNTTSATAIICALLGADPKLLVGAGTGVNDTVRRHKAKVIARGLALHEAAADDALMVLASLGGREIAAMFGALLAARMHRIPVVLDGVVVAAAALVLKKLHKDGLSHCIAGHQSAEPAHGACLDYCKMKPLLQLGMRLGEGSGAAVAYGIVRAAVATHNGMARFDEAAVSQKAII